MITLGRRDLKLALREWIQSPSALSLHDASIPKPGERNLESTTGCVWRKGK
jgi:hypothetical protein